MAKRISHRSRTGPADHEEEARPRRKSRPSMDAKRSRGRRSEARNGTAPDEADPAMIDAADPAGGPESRGTGHDGHGALRWPTAESGMMGRMVYRTSYVLSYGVIYPVALVAGLIPRDNALVHGLVDGAADARAATAGKWELSHGSRPALAGQDA
jgi:hypothetical protein